MFTPRTWAMGIGCLRVSSVGQVYTAAFAPSRPLSRGALRRAARCVPQIAARAGDRRVGKGAERAVPTRLIVDKSARSLYDDHATQRDDAAPLNLALAFLQAWARRTQSNLRQLRNLFVRAPLPTLRRLRARPLKEPLSCATSFITGRRSRAAANRAPRLGGGGRRLHRHGAATRPAPHPH